uniref:Protein HIRA-like C-terminal domain-containing protein n=1 Tax=Ciona savignyi TaxID=51511 RepID=H2YBH0_CIOSA
MGSWTYVSQPGDPIEQFTENISTMDGDASGDGEIAGLLKKKFNHGMGSLAARTFHTTASTQRDATLAMLERKLSASLLLECASQYKRWLLAYIRYVVQENYDLRLREVCDDLIGPPANRATSDALYSMETLCLGHIEEDAPPRRSPPGHWSKPELPADVHRVPGSTRHRGRLERRGTDGRLRFPVTCNKYLMIFASS